MSPTASRRALLLGATGALVTACASGRAAPPRSAGTHVDGSFSSASMKGADVGWTIVYPRGHQPGARLPVVVTLHGRGGTHATAFATLDLDTVLDQVVADGVRPFALASVDGGDHGYWHRRSDGTDPGAMVVDEFLPLLRHHGLDPGHLGLHGWSMGGYGALLLAGRDHLPVRAIAVASPALFTSAGATPQGAFDSAEDFARNDVYAHPEWLDGVPVRLDCGRSDPFHAATRRFADELSERPAGGFGPGAHTPAYWRSVAPAELAFLGRRL
jgi:dienelactone hydrolase